MEFFLENQELLWFMVVIYDLTLAIFLFKFFGKYGLYCAVVLGIILGNLQGGKVSELEVFGLSLTVSMGAILYSPQTYSMKNMERMRQTGLFILDL